MNPRARMRVEVWVDQERRVAVSRYRGTLTVGGMLNERRALAEARCVERDYASLIDGRLLHDARITARELTRIATTASASPRGKHAFLAGSDVFYGLANVYRAQSDQTRPATEVFRELAEALQWLELPSDYLERLGPPRIVLGDLNAH